MHEQAYLYKPVDSKYGLNTSLNSTVPSSAFEEKTHFPEIKIEDNIFSMFSVVSPYNEQRY